MLRRNARKVLAGVVTAVAAGVLACGVASAQVTPSVVGGSDVTPGEYPFMAVLYLQPGPPSPDTLDCGGTLIDTNSVLTAAHCVQGATPDSLGVVVGRTTLSDTSQGETRSVSRITVDPNHKVGVFFGLLDDRYDDAVITLDRPITDPHPISLPAANRGDPYEVAGTRLTVAGWGNRDGSARGADFPDTMQEALVPVVSDAEAKRDYPAMFYPKYMVAAGDTTTDTCGGDSGGPMFARTPSGSYLEVGVTIFGAFVGCAQRNKPGVYTEVDNPDVSAFIAQAMGADD